IRVVHSSHFRAIFGSFSISFLFSFFKNGHQNETRMNRKMTIFEKSNHTLASAKMVIFTFIFMFHFRLSFKLRYDAHSDQPPSTATPSFTPLPPQQVRHHLPSPLP